jgi:thiol:disulfide interchange protein
LNEKRVFSDPEVIAMLDKLDVELIQADKTKPRPQIDLDLARFDRKNIPVNIIVPADPNQPLIMMPELIGPKEALQALKLAAEGGTPLQSSLR